jgi:hypothetical protein
MSDIQLDMFEVQLGAAIMLQFRTEKKSVVCVLADAGISASGYSIDHVHKKLPDAFKSFENESRRLDLIVGTHYDEDHLEGLIPIIEDLSIEIGEAWMPPVANDTEPHAINDSVQDRHLLVYQFIQEDGASVLSHYLDKKRKMCDELQSLEKSADEFRMDTEQYRRDRERNHFFYPEQIMEEQQNSIDEYVHYFQNHIKDANSTLGIIDHGHADDEFDEGIKRKIKASKLWEREVFPWWDEYRLGGNNERQSFFSDRWNHVGYLADSDARSMAYIRKSTAKDAINAASLYKVVTALTKRSIPILWHMIQDGQPRRFVWIDSKRRFQPSSKQTSNGPEIKLLGPSEGLVKKHWDRLPVGSYMAYLAMRDIPIKNITPSNQLSYVLRFGFKEQGILITGDAGFVDAKIGNTKKYYPDIVSSLLPLHVIQVAHHGGNNAHFYRVLLKANYPSANYQSFLLLSHATNDKYRPSKEFGMFVEQVRTDTDVIKILFTSEPNEAKVHEYKDIIFPLAGVSVKSDVGDVQITFNKNWVVMKHAVHVA